MEITEFKKKALFTQRIDLSEALDEPDSFIELRELTLTELSSLGEDGKKNLDVLDKIMPQLIIDSSFTNNNEKATGQEVVAILRGTGSLYTDILDYFMQKIPFSQRLKSKKSGK